MGPRLSPAEKSALAAFTTGARALLGSRIARIVLFGSRARGEGRSDSDLDLVVEVESPTRTDRYQLIDLAADVGVEHSLVLSPVVTSVDGLGGTALGARVAADGVTL